MATALPGRRAVLLAAAVAGAGAAGTAPVAGGLPLPMALRRRLEDQGPDGTIPDAPEGTVRWEQVASRARGQDVGLFTAVPAGLGDGAGLPVCLVLHGASATTADFRRFGLARFLTAAVRSGVPPFVLVGVDGGRTRWEGGPGDDPAAMLTEEVPRWCSERGFATSVWAVHGWSMGGYGALRLAQGGGLEVRTVAALSPAVRRGESVFTDVPALRGTQVGLWCGRTDPFLPDVQALAEALGQDQPGSPAVAAWDLGGHTRRYWNRVTPAALALIGAGLA